MAITKTGLVKLPSLTVNSDNTINVSGVVGTDGEENPAIGIQFYFTLDGTNPTLTKYQFTYELNGIAGETLQGTISFADWTVEEAKAALGDSCSGQIKFRARTKGAAGSDYFSTLGTVITKTFTWYSHVTSPEFITPEASGEFASKSTAYRVSWEASQPGANNEVDKYQLKIYNKTTGTSTEAETTSLYYDLTSDFLAANTYQFHLRAIGTNSIFSSAEITSGVLTVIDAEPFPVFDVRDSDANTIPSTTINGATTYVDIGSGNVLRLTWDTPRTVNNELAFYKIFLCRFDSALNKLYQESAVELNVGCVNSFYIESSMLEHINLPSYQLAIRVVAISKYGDPYSGTSNNLIVSISKGCGTYVRVTEGYTQPVMKRAIAFAKVSNTMILASAEDYALTDENGLNFYAKTGKASDWSLMQEFYTKKNNEWKTSDIRYEVLTDKNGEIITDSNNEPIYTL